MHNILRTKLFLASALFVASIAATAQPTQIVGPIDALLAAEGKVQVIGQTLTIGPATQIAARGRLYSGSSASALLAAGRFVSVEAEQNPDSLTARFISVLNAEYVPGSTAAYVSGRVDAISSSNGTAQIGNLIVDISAVAPEVVSSITVGSKIEVIGIQPVARGPLVSAEIISIGGSGIESIGGSGIQSIGGSGIQSIGGSGIQSIGGSGVQSIGGSGTLSIGGSGVQRVAAGTESLSIGGSGAQ